MEFGMLVKWSSILSAQQELSTPFQPMWMIASPSHHPRCLPYCCNKYYTTYMYMILGLLNASHIWRWCELWKMCESGVHSFRPLYFRTFIIKSISKRWILTVDLIVGTYYMYHILLPQCSSWNNHNSTLEWFDFKIFSSNNEKATNYKKKPKKAVLMGDLWLNPIESAPNKEDFFIYVMSPYLHPEFKGISHLCKMWKNEPL